jgi:hypothetical protein
MATLVVTPIRPPDLFDLQFTVARPVSKAFIIKV